MGSPDLEAVRSAWDNRDEEPIEAAEFLAERFQAEDKTPFNLALEVGARPAEISIYLDFAELHPPVKEKLISEDLPLSLASDLIKEDDKQQKELIDLVLEGRDRTNDIPALFEKVANDYYEERGVNASTVSGSAMMHLAKKAKQYNALAKNRRSALFDIGMTKQSQGYSGLSKKQIWYINDILQELQDEDVLRAACSEEECEHCQMIDELLEDLE